MPTAEDRIVEQHRDFVRGLALKTIAELDLKTDLEDLVAFGLKGLLQAHRRFDPSRNVQFRTFAYYRIRGAIMDGVRTMARLPAHVHQRRKLAEAADEILEDAAETKAAAPSVGARTVEGALEAAEDLLGKLSASYVLGVLGQGDDTRPSSPEDAILEKESHAAVRAALAKLGERERALIDGFYFQGRFFDDVAKELGISKSWASRIHAKALVDLKAALEST